MEADLGEILRKHSEAISESPDFYAIYMVEFEQDGKKHYEDRRSLSEFQERCQELLGFQEDGKLKILGAYVTKLDTRDIDITQRREWARLPF